MTLFGDDPETVLWLVARAAGVAAYATLCLSVLTGLALRTDVLDSLSTRRALRTLHDFTAWIWIPLGALHVGGLLLDTTARIAPLDLVVPFGTPYGQLAIGLGTLSLDLMAIVVASGWLRTAPRLELWRILHRLSYAAFGLAFAHSVLAGTDFGSSAIGLLSWMSAVAIALLALTRLLWSRPAGERS